MVSSEVSILIVMQYCAFAPVSGLFGDLFESASSEFGLDPVDYFRLKKQESRKRKRRKNHHHPDLRGSFSKRKSSSGPRTEFLVPERYEPPPPDCNGGDGTLSGMTFINFLLSAIAVAANVVSNINSNQRNNNNNNNNNNDNVANYNFANNNNAANNLNTIQICPFPCIPGPPPIPTGKRRRRSEMIHGNGLKVASEVAQNVKRCSSGNVASTEIEDHGSDIYLASMLALKLYWNLNRSSDPNKAFCHLYQDLEKHEGLDRPATSLLTIVASRLAYHFQENLRSNAVSSCQHVPVGNQSSTTILT